MPHFCVAPLCWNDEGGYANDTGYALPFLGTSSDVSPSCPLALPLETSTFDTRLSPSPCGCACSNAMVSP
jgi:hypothetical protein